MIAYLLALLAGYLLGSIPFAFLLGKYRLGIDIREHGSGNVGATNLWRLAGPRLGSLCFALDCAKGFFPAFVFLLAAWERAGVVAGLAAVLGHMFPPWLKGRGGKGVATATGAFLAIAPVPLLSAFLTFVTVGLLATRTISAGSLAGAVVLTIMAWSHSSSEVALLALLVSSLAVYRHRGNLARLYHGTEARFWKGLDA